ncbi:hypothetical protein U9M48_031158 [Paspalum notatum var. saurae]|uniref:DUF4283 domain-containing protein n=1 Tax=Paspalum notatum var. saurae TaxID=547442 RepID=A0AAQ3U357_PASNO
MAPGLQSPDPLVGCRCTGAGSRFWPLAQDDSSDEDDTDEQVDVRCSAPSVDSFVQDAVAEGFSIEDLCRAEIHLSNNFSKAPVAVVCNKGEDQVNMERGTGRGGYGGHPDGSISVSSEMYCVICNRKVLANRRCPILLQPRTVAQAVGSAVQGLGFCYIPHPPLTKATKDNKTALISVLGGVLSKEQIVVQLKRLIPSQWVWDLKEHGEMSFIVEFPSKAELLRSISFGGADVKEKGILLGVRIQFEEWLEEEGHRLPKIWVRVFGIRKLWEFLNLWAVGSMLGLTQTVDMETTRKNEFGFWKNLCCCIES